MHIDGQTVAVFAIVAVAFYVVGKRLWSQVAAFQGRPARRAGKHGVKKAAARTAPSPQLIQLQTRPPLHMKRPPADDQ